MFGNNNVTIDTFHTMAFMKGEQIRKENENSKNELNVKCVVGATQGLITYALKESLQE